MRAHALVLAALCGLGAWPPAPVVAQAPAETSETGGAAAQPADAEPLFEIRGLFDAGFRWQEVDGNADKFREDLNYSTGARLFNVDLSLRPTGTGAVDQVDVYASGLGDPYESLGVTVRKLEAFDFRFRRSTSAYFYRDTILPVADAVVSKSNAGDFHHFDFTRASDRLDFDVKVGRRGTAFFAFNRQTRLGESSTTLDVSRDEFEIERPLDETKNDYTVGYRTAFERVSVYVDQTYRDYQNDVRLFLPGASLGENLEDTAELFVYNQLTPFDFTMPQTTAKASVRPTTRLNITGGVVVSDLSAEFRHQESSRGISFRGQPFVTSLTGAGRLDRTTKLGDVDVTYDLSARVAVIGGLRFSRFDQQADAGAISEGELTALEIASDIYEVGAQVYAARGVTVTGGLRYEERAVAVVDAPHDDDEGVEGAGEVDEPGHVGPHVTTERRSVFVHGAATPSTRVRVSAEYERGDYDNPWTLIAPTAMDRIKARVRVTPVGGLSVTGSLYRRMIENDLTGAIHPTVPRIGDPTRLDTTDVTLHAAYDGGPATVYGGYTRREIDNRVINEVNAGGTPFRLAALYQSDLDRVSGGGRVELTPSVAAGADLSYFRNRGSFGLDWEQYRLFGELLSPAGYLLRVTYQYNALDEVDAAFDDYRSHIVTMSVGYRF